MLELYTDGSSTGRVGEGGWAFVILKAGSVVTEQYDGADETTNNRMELSAVIEGLRFIYENYPSDTKLTTFSDSQYVVKGITEWFFKWEKDIANGKEIKNQDLWLDLKDISDQFQNLKFQWIKGHSNIKHNDRCDYLAKKGKLEIKRAKDETRQLRKS